MAAVAAGCGSNLSAWSYQYSGITWHRITYVASKAYLRNPGRNLGIWANFAMPDYNIFAVPGEPPSQAKCLQTSRRVRQRLQSALLRWGIRRPERFLAWSPRWRTWIRRVHPEPAPRGEVWNELLSQLEELDDRVTRLERAIKAVIPHHPQAPLLIAFQALRGINWVTSATVVAEFGDLTQLSHPRAVMSRVGVVPTEVSSGTTQRRGPITKTGNAHVRRVLIEAAHSYRYPPTRRGRSAQRVGAAPAAWRSALKTIDWRAQQRLHARLRRLTAKRGRAPAVAAVARELCGYLWEIAVWVRVQTATSEEESKPISS